MGLTDTPVPLPSGATATTAASGGNREELRPARMRAAAKQTLGAATRAVSPKVAERGLRQQIPVIPAVHLPAADDLKAAGQSVVQAVLIFRADGGPDAHDARTEQGKRHFQQLPLQTVAPVWTMALSALAQPSHSSRGMPIKAA